MKTIKFDVLNISELIALDCLMEDLLKRAKRNISTDIKIIFLINGKLI